MRIDIQELEGRPHYVVPTVLITAGTHAGSMGPIHYPAAVLQASASYWNAKPVVIYHPDMASRGLADNADVFNRQKIGVLFNAHFDGRRLLAECWIDVARVTAMDKRVAEAIAAKQMMEVSTGLLIETSDVTHNDGAPVATRLHPDHLAILPDQIGACSIAAGAGLCRNQVEVLLQPALAY